MGKKESYTFETTFITERGNRIQNPTIAYRSWGKPNDARDNVILVCHALTGNTAADEWFGGLFGPSNVIDPEEHFVICPNVIGSCYGSSGPTSTNPQTGESYQADFPIITIRDMVRLQQQLLDELQITGIEMVLGGSMGGMQALEWCIMDSRPKSAALFGMGKEHRPWAIGISHTQRQAIYNDPHWKEGYYTKEQPPKKGLALARMIAMNSYRHPTDFDEKFARRLQDGENQFEIESYLNYQGEKLTKRFDAVSYVRLTQAMDSHDIGRGRSSHENVLRKIDIPVLVVGIDSDLLYPPDESRELADLLPQGKYAEIHSHHGHDAFLIEFDQLKAIINYHLAEIPTRTVES